MESDGPLAPLRLHKAGGISGTHRSGGQRSSSNGRATSATRRSISAQARARANPAAGAVESPEVDRPRRSRYHKLGRRKLQRWMNSHFIDQGVEIHKDLDVDPKHLTVSVTWRSNFEPLFRPENADVLDAIRTGEERTLFVAKYVAASRPESPKSLMGSMFSRIDKRLRPLLEKEWARDPRLMIDIEALLVAYASSGRLLELSSLTALDEALLRPVCVEHRAGTDCLVLEFENAYHRLLTHATSQYFGLCSVSTTTASGSREMRISVGKLAAGAEWAVVLLTQCLHHRVAKKQRSILPRRAGCGAGDNSGSDSDVHMLVFSREACQDSELEPDDAELRGEHQRV